MRRLLGWVAIASLVCCARRVEPTSPPPKSSAQVGVRPQLDAGVATVDRCTKDTPCAARVVVGGDVTLGYHYEEYFDDQVRQGKGRDEMFAYGFREVARATQGADLFVVNLECPFTDRGEKIPKNFNFRARPELVNALLAGKVDAVSLANNHAMDYGEIGLLDTLETLDRARIPHFGAGRNLTEARRPLLLERNGVRFAFLGYFFLGERNLEPPQVIATEGTPGVAGHHSDVAVMEAMVREDVARAKHDADVVIPFFHWGREGMLTPEPYQVQLGHAAIEAGAAMVLGSHPHVLQGLELHKASPIAYSLGNFVFGGNWNPKDKDSALLDLRFSPAGVISTKVWPLRTDRYPELPVQPILVEGEAAAAVMKKLSDASATFVTPLPLSPAP
ncbi:MAG: CapA family protein [Myxococcaceae bacterium]